MGRYRERGGCARMGEGRGRGEERGGEEGDGWGIPQFVPELLLYEKKRFNIVFSYLVMTNYIYK